MKNVVRIFFDVILKLLLGSGTDVCGGVWRGSVMRRRGVVGKGDEGGGWILVECRIGWGESLFESR